MSKHASCPRSPRLTRAFPQVPHLWGRAGRVGRGAGAGHRARVEEQPFHVPAALEHQGARPGPPDRRRAGRPLRLPRAARGAQRRPRPGPRAIPWFGAARHAMVCCTPCHGLLWFGARPCPVSNLAELLDLGRPEPERTGAPANRPPPAECAPATRTAPRIAGPERAGALHGARED
jgi:hypothetical protein